MFRCDDPIDSACLRLASALNSQDFNTTIIHKTTVFYRKVKNNSIKASYFHPKLCLHGAFPEPVCTFVRGKT